jgi:hypothetical protein
MQTKEPSTAISRKRDRINGLGEPPIPALDFEITSEIEQRSHTGGWLVSL